MELVSVPCDRPTIVHLLDHDLPQRATPCVRGVVHHNQSVPRGQAAPCPLVATSLQRRARLTPGTTFVVLLGLRHCRQRRTHPWCRKRDRLLAMSKARLIPNALWPYTGASATVQSIVRRKQAGLTHNRRQRDYTLCIARRDWRHAKSQG